MEGMTGNKWKFVKRTILNQLWQNNTEELPMRLFSSLKIPRFQAVSSQMCWFLFLIQESVILLTSQ